MALNKELVAKLEAKLAAMRAERAQKSEPAPTVSTMTELPVPVEQTIVPEVSHGIRILDKYGHTIELNEQQEEFVRIAARGESCILIGAAGTGKTTTQRAVTQAVIDSGIVGTLSAGGHKHLHTGTPGIVICAYTRRAVANIKRNLPEDLARNAMTIHKLLEYEPVYYEVEDPETGKIKNTMRFLPSRSRQNPLPDSIRLIIFEEASMIGTDLHQQVMDACPHRPQVIYLGDIQQLPPTFGQAILGFKLLELPVVELTQVYRQALESPIIRLAHRILSGKIISHSEFPEWNIPGKLTIKAFQKKLDAIVATVGLGNVFIKLEEAGHFNADEDIILMPFNKVCGTIEINKYIATHLARKRGAMTYEIVAGFNKIYLSPGDRVMVDKEDAVVEDIYPNPKYVGAKPQPASKTLDYHGTEQGKRPDSIPDEMDDLDFMLEQVASAEKEDRVKAASHIVKVRMDSSDVVVLLDSAGALNSILLGYALTVHKSQGSEWRKVFLVMHNSHATMNSRELLYTAATRAREELYVICEKDTFENGIRSQRVKGDTLAEKAEYFKGKVEELKEMIQ